jgi:putative Mn2+ efflux pump MntP
VSILTTLLLAVGLALDAFAVAVAAGATSSKPRAKQAFTIAGFFGLSQALMPLVGWSAGSVLEHYIVDYDHWVAFSLLCLIGVHMIYESIKLDRAKQGIDPRNFLVLLLLSVATSIDALAAGIGFAFLDVSIVSTVMIIGIVTFVLSFFGYHLGDRMGRFFEKKVRMIGGLILIAVGTKILVEHLS